MARAKGKFVIGSIGGFVYRVYNGKQIIQAKPVSGKVNVTEASLLAAARLGKRSAFAKQIRYSFQKLINGCYDGGMVNRLTTEVSAIVEQCTAGRSINFSRFSFSSLSGFDFNLNSPMRESISFTPVIRQAEGKLTVSLPEIVLPEQLKFPSGATSCELTICVSMIRLKDNFINQYPLRQSVIAERSSLLLPAHDFIFVVPDGCLCIISMALRYSSVKNTIGTLYNTKIFNPVGILDAYITDGDYVDAHDIEWLEMPRVNFYEQLT